MQAEEKVKLARDQFPVVRERIYLDTGSVGPISAVYAETLARCTQEDLAAGRAPTHRFDRIDHARDRIRAEIAALLATEAGNIELTQSTTDGIRALLDRMPWSKGDEIVTTQLEFPRCADAINALTRNPGVVVRVAQAPGGDGGDIEWLARCITPRTRLIAFSGVAFTTGQKLPIDRISGLAAAHGIPTLVDGAQLAGAAALDLRRIGIDYLALPLQKWLCGPEGLGALYMRDGEFDRPRHDRVTRGWPVLEAAAAHLEWLRERLGWAWIHERTRMLSAHARGALRGDEPLGLVTPAAHAGLVAIRCPEGQSAAKAERLRAIGCIVRHRPEIDLLRISTAFFNTEDEIDRAVDTFGSRDGQSNAKNAFS